MLLGEIAEIKTGMVLMRKKAEFPKDVKATYRLITLKNVTDNGIMNDEPFEEFQSNDVLNPQHFTGNGDVLIRLSFPHTAIHINEAMTGLLVPSYFSIIKVDSHKFLPEYIAWYLNTDEVKKELERSQAGTRIPSTNKTVLSAIPIEEISITKQQAIVNLYNLHQKEKLLYSQLIEEKEKWFTALTKKMIKGDMKEDIS